MAMELNYDWEPEGDHLSFDDSDRFEEDSLCSWISEPESLCNNWRGWKKQTNGAVPCGANSANYGGAYLFPSFEGRLDQAARGAAAAAAAAAAASGQRKIPSLVELAALVTACHIPFEIVEQWFPPVPEQLQLRIAYWSFPDNEEDIRLYSCLATGSADEFQRGELLYKQKAVKDPLQIGFHLSATLVPPQPPSMLGTKASNGAGPDRASSHAPAVLGGNYCSYIMSGQQSHQLPSYGHMVAVVFDRRRITSCSCTCASQASWCSHVVALCLFRIHQPHNVCLRAPVSESLSRLNRDQLQKFAQYLISELPQQILPTAQKLLDELLNGRSSSAINSVCGAPDPTAGPSAQDSSFWCLDEPALHENIKKTLSKFCVPSPIVFSDVNYLSTTAPPAAAEWANLLRPLRGREPEGIWNLLSIVRELFRRRDRNALALLQILTEESLACDQILSWWFNTRLLRDGAYATRGGQGNNGGNQNNNASSSVGTQHACASLCEELVTLWRLAALCPANLQEERVELDLQLREWHVKTVDKVKKSRAANQPQLKKSEMEIFSGFKPAIDACQLTWSDYPIEGVTFNNADRCQMTDVWHPDRKTRVTSGHLVSGRKVPATYRSSGGESGGECAFPPLEIPIPSFALASGGGGGGGGGGGSRANQSSFKASGKSQAAAFDNQSKPSTQGPHLDSGSSSEGFCENETLASEKPAPSSPPVSSSSRKAALSSTSSNSNVLSGASRPDLLPTGGVVATPPRPRPLHTDPTSTTSYDESDSPSVEKPKQIVKSGGAEKKISTPSIDELDSDWSDHPSGDAGSKASNNQPAENGARPKATAPGAPANRASMSSAEGAKEKGREESQPSSDEYQIYFYDAKSRIDDAKDSSPAAAGRDGGSGSALAKKKEKKEENSVNYFSGLKPMDKIDRLEVLFARAEALHAHGYVRHAVRLAVHLSEEMLVNPPNLMTPPHLGPTAASSLDSPAAASVTPPISTSKGSKKKSKAAAAAAAAAAAQAAASTSHFASVVLTRLAFLCTVLLEDVKYHHLAFRVALFGLELPRLPASTKATEVKLFHQETELATLLRKIPLTVKELGVVKSKAESLRDGTLTTRGETLLPLMLAHFIFDALCVPVNCTHAVASKGVASLHSYRTMADELLGFEASVAAIGLKANVSEADHPLLCEGTRRMRGELALALLVYYKDEQSKLNRIMDKLLDKDVHQLYKNNGALLPAKTAAAAAASPAAAPKNKTSIAAKVVSGSGLMGNYDSAKNTNLGDLPSSGPPLSLMPMNPLDSAENFRSNKSPAGKILAKSPQRSRLPASPAALLDNFADMNLAPKSQGGELASMPSSTSTTPTPSHAGVGVSGGTRSKKVVSAPNASLPPSTTYPAQSSVGRRPAGQGLGLAGRDDSLSSGWDDGESEADGSSSHDYKAWEAKFRCMNFKTNKKPSQGMAAIDSSAPETTSSDNSPTIVRRAIPGIGNNQAGGSSAPPAGTTGASMGMVSAPQGVGGAANWSAHHLKSNHGGPGSDSGSSGNSSDCLGGSSSSSEETSAAGPSSKSLKNTNASAGGSLCGTAIAGSSGLSSRGDNDLENPPMALRMAAQAMDSISRSSTPGNNPIIKPRFSNKKSGKTMPTIPNQPSEASAHFMFELAKNTLSKAGGTSSTSLFTQPNSNATHNGPHRNLHLCAFQIGLYALGLHNCVSPNWISRTYSSHVSWITGQAMELGSVAINLLNNTWEGHLTPPEVANLADRASRGRDPAMVRAAGELALSCLPHAHNLNPNEISRALIQTKEISNAMLEKACLAVEGAAKGGGVYPEVLFEVARKWCELAEESEDAQAGGEPHLPNHEGQQAPMVPLPYALPVSTSAPPPPAHLGASGPPALPLGGSMETSLANRAANYALPVTVSGVSMAQPLAISAAGAANVVSAGLPGFSQPSTYQMANAAYAAAAAAAVVQIPPGNQGNHQYPAPLIPPPPVAAAAAAAYQYHPGHNHSNPNHLAPYSYPLLSGSMPGHSLSHHHHHRHHHHSNPPHQTPPVTNPYSQNLYLSSTVQPQSGPISGASNQPLLFNPSLPLPAHYSTSNNHSLSHNYHAGNPSAPLLPINFPPTHQHPGFGAMAPHIQHIPGVSGAGALPLAPPPNVQPPPEPNPPENNRYILAAFRVGMLALETLARRVHDDRPQTKYAKNPPYGEDVKWLMNIAMKLGTSFLHQFCLGAVNAVASPFVLFEISTEVATFLTRANPVGANPHGANPGGAVSGGVINPATNSPYTTQQTIFHSQFRSPILSQVVQKCCQMFIQCAHQRLHHITSAEYEEFVGIVCSARSAFSLSPGGIVQFNDLLQGLKRSRSCKKELWTRITLGLGPQGIPMPGQGLPPCGPANH